MKKLQKGIYKGGKKLIKTPEAYSSKSRVILKQEHSNLKNLQKESIEADVTFPEPLSFDEQKSELTTKFVHGDNLKDVKDSTTYRQFGKQLKTLHEKDKITHGELEAQDVIVTKDNEEIKEDFVLVDLPNLNKNSKEYEYAKFKVSIHLWQLKKPWKWITYNKLSKAFREGYNPKSNYENKIRENVNHIITTYQRKGLAFKIKAIFLKLFLKPRIKTIANL